MLIRSILFQLGMWIFTVPFTMLSILTFPAPPMYRYKFISLWAKTMLVWLKWTCNITFRIKGHENIPKAPFLILFVPFFGWGLAMTSPIAIDRSLGKKSLAQMLQQGLDRIRKGFCIVIFPEGTRIKPKEIGKYHIGGAWLASQTKIPILPVAHNAGFFWPKNSMIKTSGVITVSIGKVIVSNKLKADKLNQITKDWIEKEMIKINV